MRNKVEDILDNGECWCIDFFPKKIENINEIERIEDFMLIKRNKKRYAEKIINILLKIIPYYEVEFFIPETNIPCLKKYSDTRISTNIKLTKLEYIIRKIIVNDGTFNVNVMSQNMVIQLQLFNSGVYFLDDIDKKLLCKIIESEGLFFWKVVDDE